MVRGITSLPLRAICRLSYRNSIAKHNASQYECAAGSFDYGKKSDRVGV